MKRKRIPSKIKIKPLKQSLLSEKILRDSSMKKIYLNKLTLKNLHKNNKLILRFLNLFAYKFII